MKENFEFYQQLTTINSQDISNTSTATSSESIKITIPKYLVGDSIFESFKKENT